jgi:hypothetical protein
MSVQQNTYVMWGVLLPYPDDDDDEAYDRAEPYLDSAYDDKVNPKGNVTILFDGMNGKYVAVGHVVQKSRVYEGLGKPVEMSAPKRGWKADIAAALADAGLTSDKRPGWLTITHYR